MQTALRPHEINQVAIEVSHVCTWVKCVCASYLIALYFRKTEIWKSPGCFRAVGWLWGVCECMLMFQATSAVLIISCSIVLPEIFIHIFHQICLDVTQNNTSKMKVKFRNIALHRPTDIHWRPSLISKLLYNCFWYNNFPTDLNTGNGVFFH